MKPDALNTRLKAHIVWAIILTIVTLPYGSGASETPEQTNKLYYSWDVFEPDKCAAIWLLKRFVAPDASIRIVPKGESVPNAIPFDIPMARFRRYPRMSTFESMLKAFHIQDPKLIHIGQIMHDIEINIWEKKRMKESLGVQRDLVELIQKAVDSREIISRSGEYFDRLYESIPPKKSLP